MHYTLCRHFNQAVTVRDLGKVSGQEGRTGCSHLWFSQTTERRAEPSYVVK